MQTSTPNYIPKQFIGFLKLGDFCAEVFTTEGCRVLSTSTCKTVDEFIEHIDAAAEAGGYTIAEIVIYDPSKLVW